MRTTAPLRSYYSCYMRCRYATKHPMEATLLCHHHVCGHSKFYDIKLLLERNCIRTDACTEYLAQKVDASENYHAMSLPQKPRTVSVNNLSRDFNEVVFVDHML